MTYPRHSMNHPIDPHPVRPGTSAALTARTIDATVHTPLVRAQETVAALIPRVAAPLGSPLLLAMLSLTLVLLLVARRPRFRPIVLLLSAMLMVAMTSFHTLKKPDETRIADDTLARAWTAPDLESTPAPTTDEPATFAVEAPPSDESVTPIDAVSPDDVSPVPETPPSEQMVPPPDVIVQMMPPAELMRLERRQLRASLEALQIRLRREWRRQERRYEERRYHY